MLILLGSLVFSELRLIIKNQQLAAQYHNFGISDYIFHSVEDDAVIHQGVLRATGCRTNFYRGGGGS